MTDLPLTLCSLLFAILNDTSQLEMHHYTALRNRKPQCLKMGTQPVLSHWKVSSATVKAPTIFSNKKEQGTKNNIALCQKQTTAMSNLKDLSGKGQNCRKLGRVRECWKGKSHMTSNNYCWEANCYWIGSSLARTYFIT